MSKTWALVPLKSLDLAKRRLAPALNEKSRKALVLAMARDVLSVLDQVTAIEKILLVSSEPEGGTLLRGRKLDVFYSARNEGLNRELETSALYAEAQGANRALIVHGDLPLLTVESINRFISDSPQSAVRAVACKLGTGTNMLLTPLPLKIPLKFGQNSLKRFIRESEIRKVPFEAITNERLGMDIDNPEDFCTLMAMNGDETLPGPATRYFLNNYNGNNYIGPMLP
jgi:2-phospho-L-lactate guanylyltransferase